LSAELTKNSLLQTVFLGISYKCHLSNELSEVSLYLYRILNNQELPSVIRYKKRTHRYLSLKQLSVITCYPYSSFLIRFVFFLWSDFFDS